MPRRDDSDKKGLKVRSGQERLDAQVSDAEQKGREKAAKEPDCSARSAGWGAASANE